MNIRVLLYLPRKQEEIIVDVPRDKSPIDQANFIANTIEQQYPNYYRWGVIQWIIDWDKDNEANYINAK